MTGSAGNTPTTPPGCGGGFNPMATFIGISLALAIGGFARCVGLDRDRAFYPTVMIVIGSLYVLFAAIGGPAALPNEAAACVVFVALAVVGFKKSPWFIVAALVAHGLFDLVHPHVTDNGGVPAWWPEFCLAYDVTAGVLLGALLRRARGARAKASRPPVSP